MNIFDQRAETYDKLEWVNDSEYTKEIIKALKIETGEEFILDVGCGTGPIMRRLLEKYPKLKFVCIEPSTAMIEKVSAWVSENAGKEYYITIYSDYEFLYKALQVDSPPYIFDRVLIRNVLHHFKSTHEIIDKLELIFNFLKKNGRMVIGDGHPPVVEADESTSVYSVEDDVTLSAEILKIKEDRLDAKDVYGAVTGSFLLSNVVPSIKFIRTKYCSINNWLNNALISEDKKSLILEKFKSMPDEQKKRFNYTEDKNECYMDFFHFIAVG